MPVRREHRLGHEVLHRGRSLAAAQEDVVVALPVGDERARELDRDGQHSHALRPPARGQVDSEAGHAMTVNNRERRRLPAGGSMGLPN